MHDATVGVVYNNRIKIKMFSSWDLFVLSLYLVYASAAVSSSEPTESNTTDVTPDNFPFNHDQNPLLPGGAGDSWPYISLRNVLIVVSMHVWYVYSRVYVRV